MNIDECRIYLNKLENPKLEFKREWYCDPNKKLDDKGKGELIKDIIALANGNKGYCNQPGFLIIGADDEDPEPGEARKIYPVDNTGMLSDLQKLRDYILKIVHDASSPSLPDIKIFFLELKESESILILEIPSPSNVIKLDDNLVTRGVTFRKGTVLFRVGQSVCVADPTEIDALRKDFTGQDEYQHQKNVIKLLTTILSLLIILISIVFSNILKSVIPNFITIAKTPYPIWWLVFFLIIFIALTYFWNKIFRKQLLFISRIFQIEDLSTIKDFLKIVITPSLLLILVLLSFVSLDFFHSVTQFWWDESCIRHRSCIEPATLPFIFIFLVINLSLVAIPLLPISRFLGKKLLHIFSKRQEVIAFLVDSLKSLRRAS